jgi:hypothetical protein
MQITVAMTFNEVFAGAAISNKLPLVQLAADFSVLRENQRHVLYK